MAETFLSLDAGEQSDILRTVAARSGRSAIILEKDIWVCWVLQTLFSIPEHHPMAFKGGTSLSKVYGIIDRFSEDVDITLDYRAFKDDYDPFAPGASKSQNRRFSDHLKAQVERYAREVLGPALTAEAELLATFGQLEIRIEDHGETIRFGYPSAIEESHTYLKSEVLLEFGGRNVIDPNEQHRLVPDIAAFTPILDYPSATVTVLSPVRTFWEKATLIHVECHRRRLANRPDRLSRHWFDLASMARHDIGRTALFDRAILEDVVRHKTVFFNAGYARYEQCLDGRLRLVPDEDQLVGLQADYDAMRTARIVGAEAPGFDSLLEQIRVVESTINHET